MVKKETRIVPSDGGRLSLDDQDLHCGDGIDLLIRGRWVPVRVELAERWGWYAVCSQQAKPSDGDALMIRLRAGLLARWHG